MAIVVLLWNGVRSFDSSAAVFDDLDGVSVIESESEACGNGRVSICGRCHALVLDSATIEDLIFYLDERFWLATSSGGSERSDAEVEAQVFVAGDEPSDLEPDNGDVKVCFLYAVNDLPYGL